MKAFYTHTHLDYLESSYIKQSFLFYLLPNCGRIDTKVCVGGGGGGGWRVERG